MPVESYVQKFRWNEAKYPVRRGLKEIIEGILEEVGAIEDDLKGRLSDYNAVKQQLSAISRKAQGSLAVRDLSALVPQHLITQSENLTTLLAVVSK